MKKKLLSIILAVILVLTTCSFTSLAASEPPLPDLSREELFISEDVAYCIAELFLQDAIQLMDADWTSSTEIISTVTMYDETNEQNVSAYSFELTQGYIIVSAYADVPNVILEWSDQAEPLYKAFDLTNGDDVVYTGSLNYYKDDGSEELESLDGSLVERSEVENHLEQLYDISNMSNIALSVAPMEQNQILNCPEDREPAIEDIYAHASAYYGGTFNFYSGVTAWDAYAVFHTTTEFEVVGGTNYYKHCGPTAITNMLLTYANKYNVSAISSLGASNIFARVAELGSPFYYGNISFGDIGGTTDSLADKYIVKCFNDFGIYDLTVEDRLDVTYNNLFSALRSNSLAYLMLNDNPIYCDHHLIGYGLTRLKNPSTGQVATYLKLVDGHATVPRYIEITTITNDTFWRVQF